MTDTITNRWTTAAGHESNTLSDLIAKLEEMR